MITIPLRFVPLLAAALLSTGCATVFLSAHDDLKVVGLRFRSDRLVPAERFEFLREQLGDAFVAVELGDEAANPEAMMAPHSVLTEHLIDEPGQPTREALDLVLDLFRQRLLV